MEVYVSVKRRVLSELQDITSQPVSAVRSSVLTEMYWFGHLHTVIAPVEAFIFKRFEVPVVVRCDTAVCVKC
jgi:hypothetical protein